MNAISHALRASSVRPFARKRRDSVLLFSTFNRVTFLVTSPLGGGKRLAAMVDKKKPSFPAAGRQRGTPASAQYWIVELSYYRSPKPGSTEPVDRQNRVEDDLE